MKKNLAFPEPFPEEFYTMQERMNEFALQFKNIFESPAIQQFNEFKTKLQLLNFSGAYSAMDAYQKSYENMASALKLMNENSVSSYFATLQAAESLKWNKLFSQRINDINLKMGLNFMKTAEQLSAIDWSKLKESILSSAIAEDELEDTSQEITPEDRQAMADDITEVFNEPQNWEQKIEAKVAAWGQKHPVLAFLFIQIILQIMLNLFSSSLPAKSLRNACVYEKPTTSSAIIVNVVPDQEFAVIGEVPYYYEIEITNSETGEEYTGYIYKAAVKFRKGVNAGSNEISKTDN